MEFVLQLSGGVLGVAFVVLLFLGRKKIVDGKLGDGIRFLALSAITFSAFLFVAQLKSGVKMKARLDVLEAQIAKQQPTAQSMSAESK